MTNDNRIFSFAIRGDISDDRLLDAAAHLIVVPREAVAMLFDESNVEIRVEVNRHDRGFKTNLVVSMKT
jgi:hypothetical protein